MAVGDGETTRRLWRVAVGAAAVAAAFVAAVPLDLDVPSFRPTERASARSLVRMPEQSIPRRQAGYQLVTDGGDVLPFGSAPVGSAPGPLGRGVAGVAWTADGSGHWLATREGGVFTFGTARFHGSAASKGLTAPITGIAATRTGRGYWLVAADGGVFAFGDARFYGSVAGTALRGRVVGIAPTRGDTGYWLTSSDGGVFTFGDAKFRGGLSCRVPSASR